MKNLFFFILFVCCQIAFAQPPPQKTIPPKTRILFVLDGSGSMNAKWDGGLRIEVAKKVLTRLLDSMKINKNVEFALRAYGHQFDKKYQNCKDSKLEIGFKAGNHAEVIKKLHAIQPKGTTPIAYSLEQATKDFPENDPDYRNVLILITDGLESCDGDPCAISMGLQKKGIFLRPFIIGLGVGKDFGKAFDCIGKPFDAKSSTEFSNLLSGIVTQVVKKTTITLELLDIKDKPLETNVNVTFYNNVTGKPIYDIVHYRNEKNLTDTIEVDALISYDLIVNTIPQVEKKNIAFIGGKHNTVLVKSPQGTLQFAMKNPNEYPNLLGIIRENNKNQTLNLQQITAKEKYLVGKYDVEVLTLPRTYFKNVEIKQSESTTLEIATAGTLGLRNLYNGFCSLYLFNESTGEQSWIYDLDIKGREMNIAIQPNTYKLVFRATDAKGSIYTIVKKFTIEAGKSLTIDILK